MRRATLCLIVVVYAGIQVSATEIRIAPGTTVRTQGSIWNAASYRLDDARDEPEGQQLCWTDLVSRRCEPTGTARKPHDWFQIDFFHAGSWNSLWEVDSSGASRRNMPNALQVVHWSILAGPPMEAIRVSIARPNNASELRLIAEVWISRCSETTEVPEPAPRAGLAVVGLLAVSAKIKRLKT